MQIVILAVIIAGIVTYHQFTALDVFPFSLLKMPIIHIINNSDDMAIICIDSKGKSVLHELGEARSSLLNDVFFTGPDVLVTIHNYYTDILNILNDCDVPSSYECLNHFIVLADSFPDEIIQTESCADYARNSKKIVNILTGKVIISNIEWAGQLRDGWILVGRYIQNTDLHCDDDLIIHDYSNNVFYNYVNISGTLLSEFWFPEASSFNGGYAYVKQPPEEYKRTHCSDYDINYSIIPVHVLGKDNEDEDGYDYVTIVCNKPFEVGLQKYGIIDNRGNIILNYTQDSIYDIVYTNNGNILFLVKDDNDIYDVIDVHGDSLLNDKWSHIMFIGPGYAMRNNTIIAKNFNNEYFIVNLDDKSKRGPYYKIEHDTYGDSETIMSAYTKDSAKHKPRHVFLAPAGNIICEDCEGEITIGLIACIRRKTEKYYRILDSKGGYSVYQLSSCEQFDRIYNTDNRLYSMPLWINELETTDNPVNYHELIIDFEKNIIWPPGWDDPCTETYGMVIWPEGACKEKREGQHVE